MNNMPTGCTLRHCTSALALLVVLNNCCALAGSTGGYQEPLWRDAAAPYHPPVHDRLALKAPPSQLREPWHCAWHAASATPWIVVPCLPLQSSFDRADTNPYTGYSNAFQQDPFAPLRFMTHPYPLRPPKPRSESVPGAPPSQLSNDRPLPWDVDLNFFSTPRQSP